MKLLIVTQAVDLDDQVLSFFHRWIVELAAHVEGIHVICLKEGRHALPENVTVHSLGKEHKASRLQYVTRFYRYVWKLHKEYDTVLVHMNPEYLVIAGWLWRLMSKRVGLWYIHPKASRYLRYGVRFADVILSASTKSFPFPSPKLVPVGIGVDTDFFSPGDREPSAGLTVMAAARIAPVKQVECMIEAAQELTEKKVPFTFDYYGDELPRDKSYAEEMRAWAGNMLFWNFKGHAATEDIRDAYRLHDVHVNATDSGSFDKAVIEAMSCGCISVASNSAFTGVLPQEILFAEGDSHSLAGVLENVARMSAEEKKALSVRMRNLAVEKYSLAALIQRVTNVLTKNPA